MSHSLDSSLLRSVLAPLGASGENPGLIPSWSQWLGKQSYLDDLASLDPELYQGLIFLKHYTGDPEELSLNFTVAEEGEPLFCDERSRCLSLYGTKG